jgi:hypothetical protein
MGHKADVAGRDVVGGSRWGVAPTVTFGLNGPTRAILSVYHLTSHEIPDTGIPFNNPSAAAPTWRRTATAPRSTSTATPSTAWPTATSAIPRSDVGTIDLRHEFSGALVLRNVTRYGKSTNDYVWTQPDDSKGNTVLYGTVWRRANTRATDTRTAANVTSLSGTLDTAGFKHSYNAGVEFDREKTDRSSYVFTPGTNNPLTGNQVCATSGAATCTTAPRWPIRIPTIRGPTPAACRRPTRISRAGPRRSTPSTRSSSTAVAAEPGRCAGTISTASSTRRPRAPRPRPTPSSTATSGATRPASCSSRPAMAASICRMQVGDPAGQRRRRRHRRPDGRDPEPAAAAQQELRTGHQVGRDAGRPPVAERRTVQEHHEQRPRHRAGRQHPERRPQGSQGRGTRLLGQVHLGLDRVRRRDLAGCRHRRQRLREHRHQRLAPRTIRRRPTTATSSRPRRRRARRCGAATRSMATSPSAQA